jgi:hypothetical protein
LHTVMSVAVREGRPPRGTSETGRPSGSGATRSSARRRHRLLVVVLALASLLPAWAVGGPLTVAASASCTGWSSITTPPDTIRVGRSDGSVDVVKFRTYVGTVMASEWPYWLPRTALQVGAVAVKQYGWYWALAGHHRSSYVNSRGKCYDVYDTTRDQLYKPEKVHANSKIRAAVSRTWNVTLRKNGNFFMTGYRYGASVSCGADVDGSLLFERSVVDCAKKGKSLNQILQRYLSPGLTIIVNVPKPAATPKPTPSPTPTPTPTADAVPFHAPTIAGELLTPVLPPADSGTFPAPDTAASQPHYLWLLPTDQPAWNDLCLTSVGSLPSGQFAVLAELPPPFGCAGPDDASVVPEGAIPAAPMLADVGVRLLN